MAADVKTLVSKTSNFLPKLLRCWAAKWLSKQLFFYCLAIFTDRGRTGNSHCYPPFFTQVIVSKAYVKEQLLREEFQSSTNNPSIKSELAHSISSSISPQNTNKSQSLLVHNATDTYRKSTCLSTIKGIFFHSFWISAILQKSNSFSIFSAIIWMSIIFLYVIAL